MAIVRSAVRTLKIFPGDSIRRSWRLYFALDHTIKRGLAALAPDLPLLSAVTCLYFFPAIVGRFFGDRIFALVYTMKTMFFGLAALAHLFVSLTIGSDLSKFFSAIVGRVPWRSYFALDHTIKTGLAALALSPRPTISSDLSIFFRGDSRWPSVAIVFCPGSYYKIHVFGARFARPLISPPYYPQ